MPPRASILAPTHGTSLGACLLFAASAACAQQPVASVSTQDVRLQHVVSVANGRAVLANNSDITALGKTADVSLARGGTLMVCASTTLHIAQDVSPGASTRSADAGLMFWLDRGAFETDYQPAAFSDVILTPDLRLLVSGPGMARLKLRINEQGDTCVDNSGENAPYVVVSSLMNGGVYRVRAGQRVLFVHGSLNQVVDNESEPCGCPPAQPTPAVAANGKHLGGPSSTAADTAFPTAISEGLAPPPGLQTTPVVPPGVPHAEVAATLSSTAPLGPPPAGAQTTSAVPAAPPQPHRLKRRGFFGRVGHFFARIFGAD